MPRPSKVQNKLHFSHENFHSSNTLSIRSRSKPCGVRRTFVIVCLVVATEAISSPSISAHDELISISAGGRWHFTSLSSWGIVFCSILSHLRGLKFLNCTSPPSSAIFAFVSSDVCRFRLLLLTRLLPLSLPPSSSSLGRPPASLIRHRNSLATADASFTRSWGISSFTVFLVASSPSSSLCTCSTKKSANLASPDATRAGKIEPDDALRSRRCLSATYQHSLYNHETDTADFSERCT